MYTPTNECETTPPIPASAHGQSRHKVNERRSRLDTPEHAEVLHESQHFFRDSDANWDRWIEFADNRSNIGRLAACAGDPRHASRSHGHCRAEACACIQSSAENCATNQCVPFKCVFCAFTAACSCRLYGRRKDNNNNTEQEL
ncbi:hypothetical protein ANCCAN_15896 [Ancylostoma caninum]|uniref:Uncharacterized protein n=1 Tax=Ancylostoma caninum TaxID=29170 RepID=A0A368G6A7_ANCCA|nr:hypothetical protein ANCCAN_15896 [Ancylostoma caninum]